MNLQTFFIEKSLPYTPWEIEYNGETHFIDSAFVIEAILSTENIERYEISNTLCALDFQNKPIMDYLRFLAECLIKQNFEG